MFLRVLVFIVGCLRLGSVLIFWLTLSEGACVLEGPCVSCRVLREGACVSCRVLALGVGFDFLVDSS